MSKEERMEYQEKTLKCKDCGRDFMFVTGEKGFKNEPASCPDCRAERERERLGFSGISTVKNSNPLDEK